MKKAKKILCMILAIVMIMGLLPTFAITAAATDLDLFRTAAYGTADGNIARGVVPTARYSWRRKIYNHRRLTELKPCPQYMGHWQRRSK